MTTIEVYDPALCCSTGVCGTEVDQALVSFCRRRRLGQAERRAHRALQSRAAAARLRRKCDREGLSSSARGRRRCRWCSSRARSRSPDAIRAASELARWAGLVKEGEEAKPGACCSGVLLLKGRMKFLEQPPRFLFFTGKGGVGKTSIACATAVALAEAGRRVLLVSTDPASNVGQVFGVGIGNRTTAIPGVPSLSALEIDPQAAAQAYRDRIVGPVRGVLPDAVVKGIEEQLSGACTTEIAAFDEFTALLTDTALTGDYDHIIFDTAPTGHTIRLLQLPGAWSGFLEAGKGDASCLGPLAGLEKQRAQYSARRRGAGRRARTRLVLVARAQSSALREVARTHEELAAIGITQQYLVINGLLPQEEATQDALAAAICEREQAALARCPRARRPALRSRRARSRSISSGSTPCGNCSSQRRRQSSSERRAPIALDAPSLSELVDDIAADGHGLVMLMGKGGVGKTTLAAAVAVELARRGLPVHLTTSDPAAHLVRNAPWIIGASESEPHRSACGNRALSSRGTRRPKAPSSTPQGRALLEEDLRSPCTEEIAVFQAFSRIIREAGKSFVVMDTAPTGHTLLLLDATGAYHREVARQLDAKARITRRR